jgi:hypothetical protein
MNIQMVRPVFLAVLIAATAQAATRRDLRDPVESAANVDVGPGFNPSGSHGQYFQRGSAFELRTQEFYDDLYDNDASFVPVRIKDLWGQVIDINKVDRNGVDHITGFTLRVSVFNQFDPAGQPKSFHGITQLGERNSTLALQRAETMVDTLVTMEFARLAGSRPTQIDFGTDESFYNEMLVDAAEAQSTGPSSPQIIAIDPDATAWYGITPGSTRSDVAGGFIVPAYDFGTLLTGETATRDIQFAVEGAGLSAGEQRFTALDQSWLFWRYHLPVTDPDSIAPPDILTAALQRNFADVLYAHSSDLKVGNYLDTLQTHLTQQNFAINFDGLIPIGNASVFYNVPEPTTFAVIASTGVLALRRRRRIDRSS